VYQQPSVVLSQRLELLQTKAAQPRPVSMYAQACWPGATHLSPGVGGSLGQGGTVWLPLLLPLPPPLPPPLLPPLPPPDELAEGLPPSPPEATWPPHARDARATSATEIQQRVRTTCLMAADEPIRP
jgi:hypothetical protein